MKDKPSFTGSHSLDERFGFKPTTTVDIKEPETDPTEPPKDPEEWESPGRELKTTTRQVFSLFLIRRDKKMIMIPYGAIDAGDGVFNGTKFTFRFWRGEVAYEAVIEGTVNDTQKVADYIASGSAKLVRANGEEITSVTWEPIPEEEEEK